jgi:hypothetical protein
MQENLFFNINLTALARTIFRDLPCHRRGGQSVLPNHAWAMIGPVSDHR